MIFTIHLQPVLLFCTIELIVNFEVRLHLCLTIKHSGKNKTIDSSNLKEFLIFDSGCSATTMMMAIDSDDDYIHKTIDERAESDTRNEFVTLRKDSTAGQLSRPSRFGKLTHLIPLTWGMEIELWNSWKFPSKPIISCVVRY